MKSIQSLKSRLSTNDTIITQSESGFVCESGFQWNPPISDNELQNILKDNDLILPNSYIEFIKITNGAMLFEEMQYGQWGCDIFSLQRMIDMTKEYREMGYELKSSQYVFAAWLGDSDVLIFDLEKLNDKYIIDCSDCEPAEYYTPLKWGFDKWLDYLIVAQGTKFWRW